MSAQYQMLSSAQYFPSDSDVSVPGQIITWQHASATWVAVRNVQFYIPYQFPCYCTFDALTSSVNSFVVVLGSFDFSTLFSVVVLLSVRSLREILISHIPCSKQGIVFEV